MMRRTVLRAIAFALLAAPALSSAGENLEYEVKAAFLFNFLKFVEWPAARSDSPWVIGILGHDPFGDVLENTVRGKTVNGRPVEVRHYATPREVKNCNVLFIGHEDSERMETPVQAGLLTVGEVSGFLKAGGIINFYLEDGRVHFEIRAAVAHATGLHVSAQLLRLGRTR